MFNKTVGYALSMLKVFALFPDCCITAQSAAITANVPVSYGIGVCKTLARKRILRTRKGPGGGNYLPSVNMGMALMIVLDAYDISNWDVPLVGESTDELRTIYSAFQSWAKKNTIGSLVTDRVFS
jgi:hypothetical protein